MLIVQVDVHVKAEYLDEFIRETQMNARSSIEEPGIARFDVLQHSEDPTRFVLVEVYRDDDAPKQHKETAHYARWRDAVAGMMAEPRQSTKFRNNYPDDPGWG